MQKNQKLIERIKNYQKFFEKLEKKQKFKKQRGTIATFRGVPGAKQIFNAKGELNLTVEDIKAGRKLEFMQDMVLTTRGEDIMEAKLKYYKNMKPKVAVFKTN